MADLHGISMHCPVNSSKFSFGDFDILFANTKSFPAFLHVYSIFRDIDFSYLKKIPKGLIHGDFSYSNILFVNDDISALLDFDNIANSYLLTDLARCQIFFGIVYELVK